MKLRSKLLIGAAVVLTYVVAAQAQLPGVNSTLQTVFTYMYEASTNKPTYSATATQAPAAAATDFCSISGSATKTIRVRRVYFGGIVSAVVTDQVGLVKRSTAYTAGNGTAMAKVPYDSGSSASSVNLAEGWVGNPTVGTLVGYLSDKYVTFANSTTGSGFPLTELIGQLGSPVILRGIAENLAVNLNALTYTGATFTCTFEWTEE